MTRSICRTELHHLVWQKPFKALAAEFGITSARLAEICKQHDVPFPTEYYWKRKIAGLKVVAFQLPKASAGTSQIISITPFQDNRARAKSVEPKQLSCPKRLHKLHPIIQRWRDRRRQMRSGASVDFAWSATQNRQHRILNTLFNAASAHGYRVQADDHPSSITFDYQGASIRCSLRPRKRRVKIPSSITGSTRTELQNTPDLIFTIDTPFVTVPRVPHQWREEPLRPMESMLDEIFSSICKAGPAILTADLAREAERKVYLEERQRRLEKEAQDRRDAAQWAALVRIASDVQNVARVQNLLAALSSQEFDPFQPIGDRTLKEWLEWASAQCERAKSLTFEPSAIFEALSQVPKP